MQIYLVGGAVRDSLLGLTDSQGDRDYVVVGATPERLLEQGFSQVGRDFPVFLHPVTKEEYALARTERKLGKGHAGFQCNSSPTITLEEDLKRRDLTINAIAQGLDGQLIDPFGGENDLKARLLRHVSSAFSEDPLRVLRVARFAAKFAHLGFDIAPETLELMRDICASGELETLAPERIWKELEKSLATDDPQCFFKTLRKVGALERLFPEVHGLFGVPAPYKWHPEVDTGIHFLMSLKKSAEHSSDLRVRFATLCHDFGKAKTSNSILPRHWGHELGGLPLVKQFCKRLRIPNYYQQAAEIVTHYHSHVHHALELDAIAILEMFDGIDVWRKPDHLQLLLNASRADFYGRKNFEHRSYPQPDYLNRLYQAVLGINVAAIVDAGFKGNAIRKELNIRRLDTLQQMIEHLRQDG